jgi:hypothetical protein
MAYYRHLDAAGAFIEWRDSERFNYSEVDGGALVEVTEAEYLAANPDEAARRARLQDAEARLLLENIDLQSIRAIRESILGDAGGKERLASLESKAQTLRQTLATINVSIIATGGAGGGVSSIKVAQS